MIVMKHHYVNARSSLFESMSSVYSPIRRTQYNASVHTVQNKTKSFFRPEVPKIFMTRQESTSISSQNIGRVMYKSMSFIQSTSL